MADREIAKNGKCSACGGTHYGALRCPYRCDRCGTNTEPCKVAECPRNARWATLPHFAAEPVPDGVDVPGEGER